MQQETSFDELITKAAEVQERVSQLQEKLENQSFIGADKLGLVTVVLKASRLIDIQLTECPISFGDLQEATKAAINDAIQKRLEWCVNASETIMSDLNLHDFTPLFAEVNAPERE